ncbi:cytochrome P450 [Tardiphaga sp. 215_C5_N2_1]|uniref:cytochrome P450 n=1 Tax=Tardiphaga sp. 215_C5_N2_1 TaxID=3240774 RepID=UPI003F8B1460
MNANDFALNTNLIDADLFVRYQGPPHELLRAWQEHDPVHWNPAVDSYRNPRGRVVRKGFWVLTRYADVFAVSRNPTVFSSNVSGFVVWDPDPAELAVQQAGLMAMDPPHHAKFKRLVMPPFSPKSLAAFEPEVAAMARSIVDGIAKEGRCEFIFDVASRLPVYTFCILMGIPSKDHEMIFKLGNAVADMEASTYVDIDAQGQLFRYAQQLAEEKRANPDNSMMSCYVNSEVDGERLTGAQVNQFFLTVSVAGHETTRNTAAHFIRLMSEYPEQYELLRSDLNRYLPNAIEEVLRFSPPVTNFCRTALEETTIAGHQIRKDDKIYLSYPAANRDPSVFSEPDKFDITRSNANKHLSFGTGEHVCIGASLARMQLKHLLKLIVTRIPDIHPVGDTKQLRSIWFNAIMEMNVEFEPERTAATI